MRRAQYEREVRNNRIVTFCLGASTFFLIGFLIGCTIR